MDVHQNGSEKSTGKEDNFVNFLDNITSNSSMDYENEMRKKHNISCLLFHQKYNMLSSYCHY